MFLFRVAIVLALAIAVMPADKEQQERLYSRAANAAYWTATFCDRNAQTCDTASSLWATFLKKAEFAGQLAYDVTQRFVLEEEGAYAPVSYQGDGRGTLTFEDLQPKWRGETPRQGI